MARWVCSDYFGVDTGTSTHPLIRFHHMYIFPIQPCSVRSFDAWITFFQEISAVMCYGTQDRFIFQTNTFKKRLQEALFFNYLFTLMLFYEWISLIFVERYEFPLFIIYGHQIRMGYFAPAASSCVSNRLISHNILVYSRCSWWARDWQPIKMLHSHANLLSPQLETLQGRKARIEILLSPKLPYSNRMSPPIWGTIRKHASSAPIQLVIETIERRSRIDKRVNSFKIL